MDTSDKATCTGCIKRSDAMRLLLLPILLGLVCLSAKAEAPAGFAYKELPACAETADPYRTPDSLRAKRAKAHVLVSVKASLNCGSEIHPTVRYDRQAVSIALEERIAKDQPVAGCNCMRAFRFTLTEPIKPRTTVYLVTNGHATAHIPAP